MKCRFCNQVLADKFLDLGTSPPSNDYLSVSELDQGELYYPLIVYVCAKCKLVQTRDFAESETLFKSNYAYFSSVSKSMLRHAENFARQIIKTLNLNSNSFVVEIASNDGYLLKNFVAAGIPCLGIEPTKGTALVSETHGVTVLNKFFNSKLAVEVVSKNGLADLVIGNNVYAHVPEIVDFTIGIKEILKPDGTVTLEFAHLYNLIKDEQFDAVYHEHFSYLSLNIVIEIFREVGMEVYDVEMIDTHGGSLRVFGCHRNIGRPIRKSVQEILSLEEELGMCQMDLYMGFQKTACHHKNQINEFLISQNKLGKKVVGFGAAAKASTLLNYIGVREDLLPYICDTSEHKAGKFMPGTRVPIVSAEILRTDRPDYVIIFPWNIKDEIVNQIGYVRNYGCKFVTLLPAIKIF